MSGYRRWGIIGALVVAQLGAVIFFQASLSGPGPPARAPAQEKPAGMPPAAPKPVVPEPKQGGGEVVQAGLPELPAPAMLPPMSPPPSAQPVNPPSAAPLSMPPMLPPPVVMPVAAQEKVTDLKL